MKKIPLSSRIIIPLLILLAAFLILRAKGSIQQPIVFNHKIHAENDLECADCHVYFKTQAFSGKPSREICIGCHEEPQGNSKEEQKLVEFIRSGQEITWIRLFVLPDDVFFSHRRHVALGGLECKTCHGTIGESSKPPSKRTIFSMKNCIKCHKRTGVNNDCLACHR